MFKPALLAVCVSLLLTACLPSFVPLSKKNEATPAGLEGVWANDKFEYSVALKDDHYEVLGKCLSKDINAPFHYIMTIAKIEGRLYASVAFDYDKAEKDWPKEVQDQLSANVHPQVWSFQLVLEGDTLKLLVYEEDLAPMPNDDEDGDKMPSIIASHRKALREWLAKNGEKAFKEHEGFVYKRKAAETK